MKLFGLALLGFAFLILGCHSKDADSSDDSPLKVKGKDVPDGSQIAERVLRPKDGDEISVKAGTSTLLSFHSYGDGGYQWKVTAWPPILTITDAASAPIPRAMQVPGNFGDERFRIVGRTAGTGDVVLVNKRSWEKSDSDQTVTLHITVTP